MSRIQSNDRQQRDRWVEAEIAGNKQENKQLDSAQQARPSSGARDMGLLLAGDESSTDLDFLTSEAENFEVKEKQKPMDKFGQRLPGLSGLPANTTPNGTSRQNNAHNPSQSLTQHLNQNSNKNSRQPLSQPLSQSAPTLSSQTSVSDGQKAERSLPSMPAQTNQANG
jgi:hypothetical protein